MSKYCIFFALTFLGLSCSCMAKPTKNEPKPVVDTSASRTKLGDLLSLTARSYEAKAVSYMATFVKPSANGEVVAVFDGGSTRLFNADGTQILQIKDARPLTWSRTSSLLFIVDRTGRYFAVSATGALEAQTWLTDFFKSYHAATDFSDPTAYSAGDGLIAMPGRMRQNVLVANVDSHTNFTTKVGAKWGALRPASFVQIGWDAVKNQPAVFITEQLASGSRSDQIEIVNRLEVYAQDGKSSFFTQSNGIEVSYLPVLTASGVSLLSRVGEFRCLYTANADGELTKVGSCDSDMEFAVLDQSGEPIVYSQFTKHDNLPGGGYTTALRDYRNTIPIAVLPDGRILSWSTADTPSRNDLILLDDHAISARYSIGSAEATQQNVNYVGSPIDGRSKDGLQVHGYLFVPTGNKKIDGLAMLLHGGPYATETDELEAPLGRNLLDRGYAVVSVNYRGTPGYGRAYIEKGYGGAFKGMLDDIEALRTSAIDKLGLTDQVATVLYGRSFGGFLAINAMAEQRLPHTGYVLDAAVCDFSMTKDNVMLDPAKKGGISTVYDPAKAAYNLKLATAVSGDALKLDMCNTHLPAGSRLVVLHSKDDATAPYGPMAAFAKAQPTDQTILISFEQNGHDPTLTLHTANASQYMVMSNYVLDFVLDGKLPERPVEKTDTESADAH